MAKRKTARKSSGKRSSTKPSGAKKRAKAKRPAAPKGIDLKKIRADLLLAIEAMKKKSPALALDERAAADPGQAQLEEMVARINDFCERDKRCGTFMIVPV